MVVLQGSVPGVGNTFLPDRYPLTSLQEQQQQFWNIVSASCIKANVSETSLAKVFAITWNEHHFATMAKNDTGFGGRLADHHSKKLLKERANDLRLQQHYQFQQWQLKPSSNIPKPPPPPPVLDQRKPPPVESKPRIFKRELWIHQAIKR